MNVRLDLELTTIEPAGDMVYLEGRAADGAQVALYVSPVALRGSSLAAGQHVSIVLELPAATSAAPPPLRERMARSAVAGAPATARASATPRAATTAAPPTAAPPTGGTPRSASDAILSLLGKPSAGTGLGERDVDDEMDALLGRMNRGPGN